MSNAADDFGDDFSFDGEGSSGKTGPEIDLNLDESKMSAQQILVEKYDIKDLGDPDTLVNTILQLVAEHKYDRAISEIQRYQNVKNAYPQYESKTFRYFEHSIELIHAIRTKKSFPNVTGLPMSKQQELEQRVREHYSDLKSLLKRVGYIERDLRVQDARSTIWVFQTLLVCVLLVLVVAITREALLTLGTPVEVIINDLIDFAVELTGF